MANDYLLKCPLCQGHAELRRSELIDLLTERNLRDRIEKYVTELTPSGEMAAVSADAPQTRDFQKEVHSWNPQLPIWRRSPKE